MAAFIFPEADFADLKKDKAAVSELWQQCFGDSRDFIDFYFARRLTTNNMLVWRKSGKAVAMASFLPVKIQTAFDDLASLYVYAVATLPSCQGQGMATRLLTAAKHYWRKPLLLNPAEPALRDFYMKQGFQLAYESKKFVLQTTRGDRKFTLTAITPEFYKVLRDKKWQGPGYVAWSSDAVSYAFAHYAFCCGESLLVSDGVTQDILMYSVQNGMLRVVESSMEVAMLGKVLPLLLQRVQRKWPEQTGIKKSFLYLPDGMVWWPKNEFIINKNAGYFNLALD